MDNNSLDLYETLISEIVGVSKDDFIEFSDNEDISLEELDTVIEPCMALINDCNKKTFEDYPKKEVKRIRFIYNELKHSKGI